MASRNLEAHRAAHQAFNRRDRAAIVKDFAQRIEYTDQARGITVKSAQEFVDWTDEWVLMASDATVTEPRYIDAGDTTVALFIGRGTNDGPMGPLPATGRPWATAFCEILSFDEEGRVVRGALYYDSMSILAQLGHVPAPGA